MLLSFGFLYLYVLEIRIVMHAYMFFLIKISGNSPRSDCWSSGYGHINTRVRASAQRQSLCLNNLRKLEIRNIMSVPRTT